MNIMNGSGLHFRVECLMCGESLVAESDRLNVVVIAAQAHFGVEHREKEGLTGREVLEDKSLIWRIEEPMKTGKMLVRPHKGLSFEGVLKEVTAENAKAANLPPLRVIPIP
jgi:hypothetical protein